MSTHVRSSIYTSVQAVHDIWFTTMWHFDKYRLRLACGDLVCAGWSKVLLVAHTTLLEISCHGLFIWTSYDKGNFSSFCRCKFFYCFGILASYTSTQVPFLYNLYLHIARGHSPLHTGKYFNFTYYISAQSLIFNFRCFLFKSQTYSVYFLRANSCLKDQSIMQFALS